MNVCAGVDHLPNLVVNVGPIRRSSGEVGWNVVTVWRGTTPFGDRNRPPLKTPSEYDRRCTSPPPIEGSAFSPYYNRKFCVVVNVNRAFGASTLRPFAWAVTAQQAGEHDPQLRA